MQYFKILPIFVLCLEMASMNDTFYYLHTKKTNNCRTSRYYKFVGSLFLHLSCVSLYIIELDKITLEIS